MRRSTHRLDLPTKGEDSEMASAAFSGDRRRKIFEHPLTETAGLRRKASAIGAFGGHTD